MEKLVSIIILSYNDFTHTINCLKSLTKQTYKNFEVFLVDNGSKKSFFLKLKEEINQFSGIQICGNIQIFISVKGAAFDL